MVYVFGEYELDTRLYELRRAGAPCPLEPQVFDVLAWLVRHRDRVVTKDELFENVWPDRIVTESALTSRLMAARKAVGDNGSTQRCIQTLHGRGYRFIAEVFERPDATPDRGAADTIQPIPPDRPMPTSRPAPSPCLSPPPAGRAAELRGLRAALDTAMLGARQVVFIAGEAGWGKTTLVDAFLREVESAEGVRVGCGQCVEQHGAGEPYMPVLDALGRLCRGPGGDEITEHLALLAPTWLIQMPGLVPAEALPSLRERSLGANRDRMLREMAEALEAITAHLPLVLVLEDLHWSDHATLDLLALVARRREPARLLIIGTCRSSSLSTAQHPAKHAAHEVVPGLALRGHATLLPLSPLSVPAIVEYLAAGFPGLDHLEDLAVRLHQRTDGHPLFVAGIVGSWLSQGKVACEEARWVLRADPPDLTRGVPDGLRQWIEWQADQLDAPDRALLEAAGIAGLEFSAAAVAAGLELSDEEAEARCAALTGRGSFLRACGVADWPDGTIAEQFRFTHELYREVFSDRVPAGRKARLHLRIGLRLEAGYGAGALERAAELAMHFQRGRDGLRAARYLHAAAEQAVRRSAFPEAIAHLTAGLVALETLPESPDRSAMELKILVALGPAWIITKGWSAPEVDSAYVGARTLCAQLGDCPERFPVLFGLAAVHEYRGEYAEALALVEEHFREPGTPMLLESHELLACSSFHQGAFAETVEHTDRLLARCGPDEHSVLLALHGDNAAVGSHDWAALALWFLGYPDRALARAEEALRLAEQSLYSLATARVQAAFLHQFRREPDRAQAQAEAAIALATHQGFPFRVAQATILLGWALAAQGRHDEGEALLRDGLDAYETTGAAMDLPYYLALLAEALIGAGEVSRARATLEKALGMVRSGRPFYYEAELHRLHGVTLDRGGKEQAMAEEEIRTAMAVARQQDALSLELRAAASLARLEPSPEATGLLAEVYRRFTEGFETPDLREAAALLKERAAPEPPETTHRETGPEQNRARAGRR